ncbi:MAG: hypothetical protein RSE12_17160 [Fuscovulum sp.]|nr:MAG: hypothetical protein RSE12_17160 [Fuscovulum sp.]
MEVGKLEVEIVDAGFRFEDVALGGTALRFYINLDNQFIEGIRAVVDFGRAAVEVQDEGGGGAYYILLSRPFFVRRMLTYSIDGFFKDRPDGVPLFRCWPGNDHWIDDFDSKKGDSRIACRVERCNNTVYKIHY